MAESEVKNMEKRAPRLQFTDEERADSVLKKPVRRVQKAAAKADKAQAKMPKKTIRTKERVTDPTTGKVTTRLKFEEIDRKKPPSKLTLCRPGRARQRHFDAVSSGNPAVGG
jgi:hypothetical protein